MELIIKNCANYVHRSINHEMYLQKICESTQSPFDEKRTYVMEIESLTLD